MKCTAVELHRMIEYIKQQDFPFTPEDVAQNVSDVLVAFGFCPMLDVEDRAALRHELLPFAEENESREAARLVLKECAEEGMLV
ncbi:MAG TPA: hypothetical protein VJK72_04080 [Candidatus Nanoarchaeia archaeon]|nr:hypothetical protein [Candidatus Nanoarchaeia archaeon]